MARSTQPLEPCLSLSDGALGCASSGKDGDDAVLELSIFSINC
jgi:hypothetical protein